MSEWVREKNLTVKDLLEQLQVVSPDLEVHVSDRYYGSLPVGGLITVEEDKVIIG